MIAADIPGHPTRNKDQPILQLPAFAAATLLASAPVALPTAQPTVAAPPAVAATADAATAVPAAVPTSAGETGPAAKTGPAADPGSADDLGYAAETGAASAAAPAPQPDQSPDYNPDDIIVSRRGAPPREDPIQGVNLQTYQAVQALDKAFVGPVAMGYKKGVPKPVRQGIANFIDNLDEPVVFLSFLLQLKPGKAAETLGRFAINSTLGIGGLVDVAKKKPFNLPHRANGIADTLGYYGVGPGPFLFVPGIGPTSLRDLFGRLIDISIVPRLVGSPFSKPAYTISKSTINALNYRVANDDRITELRDRSDDGYGAIRRDYLKRRQEEIDGLRGRTKVGIDLKDPASVAAAAPLPQAIPIDASPAAVVATATNASAATPATPPLTATAPPPLILPTPATPEAIAPPH